MSVASRNKERKFLATWLNNIGTGLMSVGAFTPVAALLLGVEAKATANTIALVILSSIVVGILLHGLGRLALVGYEE
jgi:hypothetical protein